MQKKNVCQNNDEDMPLRGEEQIADDAYETVGEPECGVGESIGGSVPPVEGMSANEDFRSWPADLMSFGVKIVCRSEE
ncbi:hypothetical protein ElyMa_001613000 [Elysia marginata]|uniref:Uncharacterized protein n=1 Tax=Elysia marginata TaxID=1093978 RepID=A0AAV4JJ40_9GAST|nr:hypothetical protein ElyMa_001613000 [Elysia marginata]